MISEAPAFGGTPADFSVVQAIQELKARGYRVTFYPFVLMDVADGNALPDPYSDNAGTIGQAKYPWRGRITCSPAAGYAGSVDKTAAASTQVDVFFGTAQGSDFVVTGTTVSWTGGSDWGYRRMVLHYAKLCAAAGGVDSFLIGSELRGLTQVRSSTSVYPAVAKLKTLAADVSAILGTTTKVGYAADWSEYFGHHPQDGSEDVYFNLDPLWADSNINFVGIDNYMPLADWREGFSHADALAGWSSIYDRAYLEANVEGGEGYDWYYASPADRDAQLRTPITDGASGKPWVFRYKDIRAWWSNAHYDRPGGVESASPTVWVAKSKPIRFTEAGCPAVDKGANQPNVFVDPKSSESALPYYSLGNRDDAMQRRYIEALYHYWSTHNPSGGTYGGPMLEMGELAIWCWDARPYPAFPGRAEIWGDAQNWQFGHWLNGRLGDSGLAALVRELCRQGGLADTDIDVSQLAAAVPGYTIEAIASARASIEPLARFYGFDAVESDGVIRFVPRGGAPIATVAPDDLVATKREDEDIELVRGQETELPLALKWRLTRPDKKYESLTVEARRITVDTARIASESFPLVTSGAEADMRCRRALMEAWVQRETAKFQLPPSRLALDPTDVVLIAHDGRQLEFRLAAIADQDARLVEAVRTDAVIYGARPGPERDVTLPPPVVYGPPVVSMMDLPILDEAVPAHRPFIGLYASPWYGRAAVWKSPALDGFALLDTIGRPARMGTLAFDVYGGPTDRFDYGNVLYVDLLSGTLTSVTDLELFAGANTLAVESAAGTWEIVQFSSAELVAAGRYKLTRLLRGQRGTESAIGNPAPAGVRVVMLDADIAPLSIASTDVGITWNWMVGPASEDLTDISYAQVAFAPKGIGLRPYAVAHVSQPWKFARTPGDLTISWTRRTRAIAGDSWEAIEVPLFEDAESYEVDILNGSTVKRTLAASSTSVLYNGAQQIADWGALLVPGNSLQLAIYQLSAQFGRGAPKLETLYF
ncbi:MAG: glycoside hydrolase/phage tail family protein [Alphaproteobacteria bacterium]|nr:glycoside hydrolase/phage tail family protein [Alphaproteobacteria bacterium]